MSNSLWPHGMQHTRPPCPLLFPGVHPNSLPLSKWCHPTISSSVIPFSSCLPSFPAHQGLLFQWVNPSHQVAKVLELQIQHQSFQWISSVQSLSHVQLFVTSWTAALQDSLSISISQSLLKLMSVETVMPSNHLILCCPFSCLQSFLESGSFPMIWLFASGGPSIGASVSVLPMNIQGWSSLGLTSLISLLSKSLFQHHSLKAYGYK